GLIRGEAQVTDPEAVVIVVVVVERMGEFEHAVEEGEELVARRDAVCASDVLLVIEVADRYQCAAAGREKCRTGLRGGVRGETENAESCQHQRADLHAPTSFPQAVA